MAKRKIIKIDEEKCNGCGLCIPNCPEGAIQLIDGKARLIGDLFCDGLGACLGHCPQGAISIEEREAEKYDERKAKAHAHAHASGCPGSHAMKLSGSEKTGTNKTSTTGNTPRLGNWPVQITLVPPQAPYLKNADILIAADCVPFAYADFHEDLLKDKVLLVGCPKLDDLNFYKDKIAGILKMNDIRSITYAHMEVPCCFGLVGATKEAIKKSGKPIPFKEVVISIKGEKLK